MTTAPTVSSITASGGAWSGVQWTHDSSQDVNDANTCMKVYEKPASQQAPNRGFALIYYKTGAKAGKQYIHVDEGDPANNDSPNSIENVTQSTGGQSGTAEVEYTTGDAIKMWASSYPQQELVQVTTDSTWNFTSGPNVTSITSGTIYVPSDTISVSDFTLKKDTTAYTATTSNLNLTGPTVYEGSRFYDYSIALSGSGVYERTIDSKSYTDFEYDNSWESDVSGAASGRQTNSSRILNVLGAIPTNLTVNNVPSGFTKTTHTTRKIIFKKNGANASSFEQYTGFIRGTSNDVKFKWIYFSLVNYTPTVYHEAEYSIGAQENIVFQPFGAGVSGQINHIDWVYFEEEGDGYIPPKTGGGPRRYPLIMTNLFDRQRSDYAIGKTHKDLNTGNLF